jgi:hypothetical protein
VKPAEGRVAPGRWRLNASGLRAVGKEGTVNITEEQLGKLPTREEALRMIQDSGGKVIRDVETHGPDSVSTHQYPHINYETASGVKGAIKVQQ